MDAASGAVGRFHPDCERGRAKFALTLVVVNRDENSVAFLIGDRAGFLAAWWSASSPTALRCPTMEGWRL